MRGADRSLKKNFEVFVFGCDLLFSPLQGKILQTVPDIWNHKTNFKVLLLARMPDLELKRKSKVLLLCLDVLADLLSLGKR